jgi:hypothetical protein
MYLLNLDTVSCTLVERLEGGPCRKVLRPLCDGPSVWQSHSLLWLPTS